MNTTHRRRTQRGISLIEALVALVVMAFGTMAVLGVQATLRINGDIAKQRAEAVRIAQESLERWRGFSALSGDAEGTVYYEAIADGELTVVGTNATYTVTLTVPDPSADPRVKVVVSDVAWEDRSGQNQTVRLSSAIFGVSPELAGTLAVPANTSVVRNPGGRHPAIPRGATEIEGGRSQFTPPGAADGVRWIFDNSTGFITNVCGPADNVNTCPAFAARLLAGYIQFSTGGTPSSEIPASPRLSGLQVRVVQTAPAEVAGTVQCFEDTAPPGYTPYYCAVPVGDLTAWSGQSLIAGLDLANDLNDDDDDEFRVCRYTRYREHRTVPAGMRNEEHPLNYVNVDGSLVNQNFLVISAGDGDEAYDCPDDVESTPVDGTTWHHQPSS